MGTPQALAPTLTPTQAQVLSPEICLCHLMAEQEWGSGVESLPAFGPIQRALPVTCEGQSGEALWPVRIVVGAARCHQNPCVGMGVGNEQDPAVPGSSRDHVSWRMAPSPITGFLDSSTELLVSTEVYCAGSDYVLY